MTDDLISRQAAISAIRASASKYTGFMEMEMYTDDDAVEAINGVPSAQQWIPCSERLPIPNGVLATEHVYYLVQNEYGDMMVATFIRFPGGARIWEQMYQDGAIMEDIAAWMPLPECYKGES